MLKLSPIMAQNTLKRIRIFNAWGAIPLLFFLLPILHLSVVAAPVKSTPVTAQMISPKNQKISLRLAITPAEQQKGLSGLKPHEFGAHEGMLFINKETGKHRFWMPDTYFNLDIIFLDSSLKIIGLEKNVPHHPGFKEPPFIYRTEEYLCQYILETKAQANFSKHLKVGDILKWKSATSLLEIGRDIHR